MSNCLDKIGHSCGTSDALQVFEREDGGVDGYCYACRKYIRHPYGDSRTADSIPVKPRITKSKAEIDEELMEIQSLGSCDLVDRRLRKSVLDEYEIKIGFSEADGVTPVLHYYPYKVDGVITGYKVRLVENKRMWSIGDVGNVDLFGWDRAVGLGVRRLIIVEGELDAPSLTRILDINSTEQYRDSQPAVVSLPHGAAAAGKDLARLAPKIRKHFKDISFCFDNDSAGQLATEAACLVFPEATVITLPEKDANDCLVKGKGKGAFKACTFNATRPKNSRIVWLDDVWEEAKEQAQFGVSWPWAKITDLTRGIRKGETIYIGAAQKMGRWPM